MTDLLPGAIYRPIDHAAGNSRAGGIDLSRVRMYVPHIVVGLGSPWGYFNTYKPDPRKRASAQGWVGRDGHSEQFMALTDTAYAVGNWNPVAISWESEGYPEEPLTDAQLDVHAANVVALRAMGCPIDLAVNHDDPDGSGVTPHCILGGGHTCPNSSDEMGHRPGVIEAQYDEIVRRAAALEGGHPTTTQEDDDDMTDEQAQQLDETTKNLEKVIETLLPALEKRLIDHIDARVNTAVNDAVTTLGKRIAGK